MYYFIVNPKSRTGHGEKIWAEIQKKLQKEKIPYHSFSTEYAGHAKTLAEKITQNLTVPGNLVVLGGDGTLNEVLEGIKHLSKVYLYYIPTGSGNDFARGMGIPYEPLRAFDLLKANSRTVPIDLGILQTDGKSRRFAVSAGIGFDAAICHEALTSPLKAFLNRLHLGKLTYLLIAVKQLILSVPADMELEIDGKKKLHYPHSYFAAIMNQCYEGGGIKFCPNACPSDGNLDVCLIGGVNRIKFVFLLLMCLLKKHKNLPGVHIFRCKSINIKSSLPLPVHTDGESGGTQSEISVKLEKEPLNVILPMI